MESSRLDNGTSFGCWVYRCLHFAFAWSMGMIAGVAQLIEQLICNHQVGSLSLPSGTTI